MPVTEALYQSSWHQRNKYQIVVSG